MPPPVGWGDFKNQKRHESALTKIQKKLMQPEVKQAGKQQIQEKAKESILAFLKKAKQDSAQKVPNRKKQQEKQDMELLRHLILRRNQMLFS